MSTLVTQVSHQIIIATIVLYSVLRLSDGHISTVHRTGRRCLREAPMHPASSLIRLEKMMVAPIVVHGTRVLSSLQQHSTVLVKHMSCCCDTCKAGLPNENQAALFRTSP